MKIKAFNILNQNGNPAANQIEIIISYKDIEADIFQSYRSNIAQMDYITNTLMIDTKAYNHSVTTTKYLNIWINSYNIDSTEIRRIFNEGGGKYKDLNVVIVNLNN